MKLIKANIKDIPVVVDTKMKMFEENNVTSLLQDNVREKIISKYKLLYNEDKCCHFFTRSR